MTAPKAAHAAFTLVELLVALSVAAGITALVTATLVQYQRTQTTIQQKLHKYANINDALTILTPTIRSIARSDTIRAFGDTAMQINVVTGASSLCTTTPTLTSHFTLAPASPPATLTAWATPPSSGDILLAYYVSPSDSSFQWLTFPIVTTAERAPANCDPLFQTLTTPAPFAPSAPLAPAYEIETATVTSVTLIPGTPLRIVTPTRYNIYRASDSHWYLGVRHCTTATGTCTTVQPIAGPFGSSSTPPLSFTYSDATGNLLEPKPVLTNVALVTITINSDTSSVVNTITTSVAPRNP